MPVPSFHDASQAHVVNCEIFNFILEVLLSISPSKLCGIYKWNLHLVGGGCLWWEGATVADESGGALLRDPQGALTRGLGGGGEGQSRGSWFGGGDALRPTLHAQSTYTGQYLVYLNQWSSNCSCTLETLSWHPRRFTRVRETRA